MAGSPDGKARTWDEWLAWVLDTMDRKGIIPLLLVGGPDEGETNVLCVFPCHDLSGAQVVALLEKALLTVQHGTLIND